jgi:hypothetical protein
MNDEFIIPLPKQSVVGVQPKRCVVAKKLKTQKSWVIPGTFVNFISGIFKVTPSHRKTTIYTFSATFRLFGVKVCFW